MAKALLLSLQLPHWLIIAGAALIVVGLIGLVISRRRRTNVQDEATTEPSSEPRPQLSPLPDLLNSRPRKDRREI
ncbi:LPXTG-motif cell wall anchor domain-containing protein [Bradyrhizobium brasilense]|uniref:LPXTG-motif cell wall anchor domain-containing protein n=1 Tax=Bradyrhizobium brasilense TaxID=1419277 RepID=A0A1G7H488_9BRAD|nr:LPXTG-motif cell wall anchor domain-containing protein [Bradyrhizobium brasilense]